MTERKYGRTIKAGNRQDELIDSFMADHNRNRTLVLASTHDVGHSDSTAREQLLDSSAHPNKRYVETLSKGYAQSYDLVRREF